MATSSLPGPLRKAVRSAKPGLIAKPVLGPGGWYVLDVVAVHPAQTLTFAQVRAQLTAELTRVKRAKALGVWLGKARKEASIQQK